ncbi:hypothetical protein E8E13_004048 [Curvularia kusanoi]|uniref:HD/PDEase domain-containing protein n=1 Tax=Curvularia kusanoi TaxID=90978 RepID=A0A9P4W947_CURKU|nr:hypothetical protein E8E13_004048 [Curvularia kusanoi]
MCPTPPAQLPSPTTTTSPTQASKSHVPCTPISTAAFEHAAALLAPAILNHSMRVYLYASALATHTSSIYSSNSAQHDLLFTACLFHDLGTCSAHDSGTQRFEVEGANAAVEFLRRYDAVSEAERHAVWTAIACHTSPHIAEGIGELARLVRVGVVVDFGRGEGVAGREVLEGLREGLEREFGREGIEKVLGDAVVRQAAARPEKAPMVSWPGVLYRAWREEPEWEGVNKMF